MSKILFGTVEKVETNHDRVRTELIPGCFVVPPTAGRSFVLIGEPLDKRLDHRLFSTSTVQAVEEAGAALLDVGRPVVTHYSFKTLNSVYRLTGVRLATDAEVGAHGLELTAEIEAKL